MYTSDESLRNQHALLIKFLTIFSVLISLNLLVINVYVFLRHNTPQQNTPYTTAATLGTSTTQLSCPQSCISKINEAVSSLQPASKSITSSNSLKEFFIPIGTGTNASNDWEDVPGLLIEIDPSRYGKIKTAQLEASVHVPSGNQIVYVRLYNITDSHPVWFSELGFNNAGTAQTQKSSPITLENGNKSYKIQMKTQLKYTTSLTSSRIRILTY